MDTERPHRTTTTSSNSSSTSELFVCFTSRLSSSSMKLTSKSILSPSRSRDPPQISLSTSLSRRLRSNGSMKGGQASPMFPTGGKRRGCGFENPEPSSPKVTCIGQVRVKTKKQGKKMRARTSKRRSEATSFRKTEQGFQVGSNIPDLTRQNSQSYQFHNHQNLQQECLKHRNNQRWVHIPLTICEALREFNCFFPCRSSCMTKEEKGEREGGSNGREGSCGAAFARWLVALQEGDDVKGREIELVMGSDENGDDERYDDDDDDAGRSRRRHVFEDIDIDVVEGKKHDDEEEEEKGRVSICIPPKNALLLMRCRSDPVKMAALANKFWESPVHKEQHDEQDDGSRDEEEEEQQKVEAVVEEVTEEVERCGEEQHIVMEEDEEMLAKIEEESICEKEREASSVSTEEDHVLPYPDAEDEEEGPQVLESYEIESITNPENNQEVIIETNQVAEEHEEIEEGNANDQDETFSCVSSPEANIDLEKPELQELYFEEVEDNVPMENEKDESSELSSSPEPLTGSEQQNDEAEDENAEEPMAETSTEDPQLEETADTPPTREQEHEPDPTQIEPDPNSNPESNESPKESKVEEREREALPECLLLMMCEPKLSMEVSKETWVCSTDFIRWLPERPAAVAAAKRASLDSKLNNKPPPPSQPPLMQPARSSCSFPAAPTAGMSMATMIEQKLLGSKSNNYEPFVLTRCKSEPMRSSAMAKLAAENCFWKNRKLQPHPPPAIGAPAGVGC